MSKRLFSYHAKELVFANYANGEFLCFFKLRWSHVLASKNK